MAIVLGNLLLFGRTLPHFFLSDDFVQIERATRFSLSGLFDIRIGLYRPVPSTVYKLMFKAFGFSPVPFNVLNLLIQIGNSVLVMWLGFRLTRSIAKGFLCGAIFTFHFMHVEPVIWVACLNHLLTAGFLLGALILFDYGGKGRRIWSLALFALALLSQEAAVVLPLFLLLWLWASSKPVRLRETVPYFVISLAYLVLRIPSLMVVKGTGAYAMRLGMNVAKNVAFIISSMFFRLNFRELLATWNAHGKGSSAALEVLSSHPLAAILVVVSLACFGIMFWRGGRAAKFGAAWLLCSMLAVIFLVGTGERVTYLPSVGFAVMSGVIILRLKKAPAILAASAVCIYLFTVGFVDSSRWIRASEISEKITGQLAGHITQNPGVRKLYVQGLPDNYKGAYVFRGGTGAAARLISGKKDLQVINIDEEHMEAGEPGAIYLRYVEGRLRQVRRPIHGP